MYAVTKADVLEINLITLWQKMYPYVNLTHALTIVYQLLPLPIFRHGLSHIAENKKQSI